MSYRIKKAYLLAPVILWSAHSFACPGHEKEVTGLRMTQVKADSVYQQAGLKEGDVIKEINGVKLSDPAEAIKLLNSLKGESEIKVRLERNGEMINLVMQTEAK